MNYKDKISIGIKNLKKRKSNILNVIIVSIVFISIFVSISFMQNIYDFVSSRERIFDRVLMVSYNPQNLDSKKIYDYLETLDHVIKIVQPDEYLVSASIKELLNEEIGVGLYGADESIDIKIKYGRNIKKDETKVIVLPEKISYGSTDFLSDEYIDTKKLLNEDIQIAYYIIEYDKENPMKIKNKTLVTDIYKVVGIYNSTNEISDGNCFINFSDVKEISKTMGRSNFTAPLIYIDSAENINYFKEKFVEFRERNGDVASIETMIDYDLTEVYQITKVIYIMIIFAIFIFVVMLVIFLNKTVKRRKKEIGLYKSMGYSNRNILSIFTIEQTLMVMFSFFCSTILYFIIHIYYVVIIQKKLPALLRLPLNYPTFYSFISLFLFLFLTALIFNMFMRKIKNINSSILMKE